MPTRPHRLLLVEDDREMRGLLADLLERDGYEVVQAASGTEAFEELRRALEVRLFMPDLIVTDVRMPGPSGLHVLEALRVAGWGVPVVIVTAFASPELRERAERFGPVLVLDKPFDMDDLRAAIVSLGAARVPGDAPLSRI